MRGWCSIAGSGRFHHTRYIYLYVIFIQTVLAFMARFFGCKNYFWGLFIRLVNFLIDLARGRTIVAWKWFTNRIIHHTMENYLISLIFLNWIVRRRRRTQFSEIRAVSSRRNRRQILIWFRHLHKIKIVQINLRYLNAILYRTFFFIVLSSFWLSRIYL